MVVRLRGIGVAQGARPQSVAHLAFRHNAARRQYDFNGVVENMINDVPMETVRCQQNQKPNSSSRTPLRSSRRRSQASSLICALARSPWSIASDSPGDAGPVRNALLCASLCHKFDVPKKFSHKQVVTVCTALRRQASVPHRGPTAAHLLGAALLFKVNGLTKTSCSEYCSAFLQEHVSGNDGGHSHPPTSSIPWREYRPWSSELRDPGSRTKESSPAAASIDCPDRRNR